MRQIDNVNTSSHEPYFISAKSRWCIKLSITIATITFVAMAIFGILGCSPVLPALGVIPSQILLYGGISGLVVQIIILGFFYIKNKKNISMQSNVVQPVPPTVQPIQVNPTVQLIQINEDFEVKPKPTRVKNPCILIKGTHPNCGAVNEEGAKAILSKIIPPKNIKFNPNKVVTSLSGGTCSAMCLTFVRLIEDIHSLDNLATSVAVSNHIQEKSDLDFLTLQSAMNCIELIDTQDENKSLQKMQTLCLFQNLKIEESSKSFNKSDFDNNLIGIQNYFENYLQDGTYLVRCILPLDNEIQEKWGHSFVYRQFSSDSAILYDPNQGVIQFSSDRSTRVAQLIKCIHQSNVRWETPIMSFYKLA